MPSEDFIEQEEKAFPDSLLDTDPSVAQEDSNSDTTSIPPSDNNDQYIEDDIPELEQEPEPVHIKMANQIRIVDNFVPNPIDTVALRRYFFPGNRFLSQMITRYIDIPYFNVANDNTNVTRGIVLNLYAKGRCILERWSATTSQRTIAALKAVAPNLPN